MKSGEVVLAILRGWPGAEERLERLARANGLLFDDDGKRLDFRTHERWLQIETSYFQQWARSFMSERLERLTDDELSIRHAICERVLIEVDERATGQTVTQEQNDARLDLATIDAEIARRARGEKIPFKWVGR